MVDVRTSISSTPSLKNGEDVIFRLSVGSSSYPLISLKALEDFEKC